MTMETPWLTLRISREAAQQLLDSLNGGVRRDADGWLTQWEAEVHGDELELRAMKIQGRAPLLLKIGEQGLRPPW